MRTRQELILELEQIVRMLAETGAVKLGSGLYEDMLEHLKRDQRCGICAHFVASSLRCALPTGEGTFTMAGCSCENWKELDDDE